MKRILNVDSLNKKLLIIFLSITIIPLLMAMAVIYYAMEQGFSKLINDRQREMEHTIQTEFDRVAEELLELTFTYSQEGALVSAFMSGERSQLLNEVEKHYPRLQKEHALEVFEFGDASGVVALRGHNPEKFGDDKSDLPAIQFALKQQSISGFEFGKSGLAVRAFTPIVYDNTVIGTLQTGLDDSFLQTLSKMLPNIIIDIYDRDGEVVVSSDEQNIGGQLAQSSILTAVEKGEVISQENNEMMHSYMPMYDPTGSNLLGVIGVTQNLSVIYTIKQQGIMIALAMILLTFIIVIVVSFKFSRTIANPITYLASIMEKLSKGDLTVEIEKNDRADEIGRLTYRMERMKNVLHHTIGQVAAASTSVANQSEELVQSATGVKAGSEQIAMTMREIAQGSEKQTETVSILAETMEGFSSQAEVMNQDGKEIHTATMGVLTLTKNGHQLMLESEKQMIKVDDIVRHAVEKMSVLNEQTREISQLVTVVQEVAEQTNLLALNAAIEAARAGENGKGFAVVATEVRKLAEQVSKSVADITTIVGAIQADSNTVMSSLQSGYEEVEVGTEHIQKTSSTFNEINQSVVETVNDIQKIVRNLSEFAYQSKALNHEMEGISAVSQQSLAGIEETTVTSQQARFSMEEVTKESEALAQLADDLHMLVNYFTLHSGEKD